MNGKIVDLLLLLNNGTEDLGIGGTVPGVFLDILPNIKYNGHKHNLSDTINIVAVEVEYREKFYFSVPNPRSCKGLDPHIDFPILGCYPLI